MPNFANEQVICFFAGASNRGVSDLSGKRTHFINYIVGVLIIAVFASLVTACASTRNLLYPDGAPDGSLVIAQIQGRFTSYGRLLPTRRSASAGFLC
jgi:hypothetical protein